MRRSRHEVEDEESSIDLTPMLDVVFIMLIFFIVTASFVKEVGIEVNRPSASPAEPSENKNILLMVNANDEIWLGNRRIDVRAVRAHIERLHAESPEGVVIIRADDKAKVKTIVEVADASREAGVYEVSIANAGSQ